MTSDVVHLWSQWSTQISEIWGDECDQSAAEGLVLQEVHVGSQETASQWWHDVCWDICSVGLAIRSRWSCLMHLNVPARCSKCLFLHPISISLRFWVWWLLWIQVHCNGHHGWAKRLQRWCVSNPLWRIRLGLWFRFPITRECCHWRGPSLLVFPSIKRFPAVKLLFWHGESLFRFPYNLCLEFSLCFLRLRAIFS